MEERDAATPENRERDIEMLKETASDVAETFTPYGDYLTGKETVEDFKRGDYGSAALGAATTAIGLIPGVGPAVSKIIRAGKKSAGSLKSEIAEAVKVIDDPDALDIWKKENKVSQEQKRVPEVQEAAEKLSEGKITSKEYRHIVKKEQPIKPITSDTFPELPTKKDIAGALLSTDARKVETGIVGLNKTIPDGTRVGSRLDIPSYEKYDTWIVSLHDGTKQGGKAIGYGQTAVLKDVEFMSSAKGGLGIAKGKSKSTIARIHGDYYNEDPELVYEAAKKLIDDPEWTQVGMNPFRHSYFYDKSTGMPVTKADEVVQVGPLVLAKGVKKPTKDELKKLKVKTPEGGFRLFNQGGAVTSMKEQMSVFEDGGLMDQGGTVDPVSGNDVPTGSMQKEVRDDIPAQISVGEYVIPADVVRFYGIKFFEELRMGAKEGMQLLKAKGQVGNGDEQVVPDDVPFEMADLVLGNDDDEEGMEFNPGGFVNPYGVYQQKQVPVVTVPSAFQAQAAPQVTSQQQYDAKPVFPAQAVQQQVGQRRPVFSAQDLFPKTQKQTTKEEDPVEETKVETAQVLDKELGDGGQSSADKAESDQFDRDLALSSIEAGIDGLSVEDGKLSFDSKFDLGVLGTLGGFLPGPAGIGIGMADAIGKGSLSSGLTAIGQTLSELGFNTTGIDSVASSVGGVVGLVQSGLNSDYSKEVQKGLAAMATAQNITIDQAFAQVSKTAKARAISLAGDPTGGLGGGYSSDPTGTGISGFVDPATGAVSAFGPAGSFKDLAEEDPDKAQAVLDNRDFFTKAIENTKEKQAIIDNARAKKAAEAEGSSTTEADAPEAMGFEGDVDEGGGVDDAGTATDGMPDSLNKGGFISKRKMRRQKAKDKRKGLAARK